MGKDTLLALAGLHASNAARTDAFMAISLGEPFFVSDKVNDPGAHVYIAPGEAVLLGQAHPGPKRDDKLGQPGRVVLAHGGRERRLLVGQQGAHALIRFASPLDHAGRVQLHLGVA